MESQPQLSLYEQAEHNAIVDTSTLPDLERARADVEKWKTIADGYFKFGLAAKLEIDDLKQRIKKLEKDLADVTAKAAAPRIDRRSYVQPYLEDAPVGETVIIPVSDPALGPAYRSAADNYLRAKRPDVVCAPLWNSKQGRVVCTLDPSVV